MDYENELVTGIIGAAIHVHTVLGPGLLENVYKECLYHKLKTCGYAVEKERVLPVVFEGVTIECGYRLDLLVENKIVLELKCVRILDDVHLAQTLTYLRLGGYRLGLLINFNTPVLKNGIKRVINGY